MLVDTRGRPLATPAPSAAVTLLQDWEGPAMQIKLDRDWCQFAKNQVVIVPPNTGRWLVRTNRGTELKGDEIVPTEIHKTED